MLQKAKISLLHSLHMSLLVPVVHAPDTSPDFRKALYYCPVTMAGRVTVFQRLIYDSQRNSIE